MQLSPAAWTQIPGVTLSFRTFRICGLLAWTFAVLALIAQVAPAMGQVLPDAPGIRVISSDEVLASHTSTIPSGELIFTDAYGARIRLITDVGDPQIANAGNGRFYPADESEVIEALRELPGCFLRGLSVTIYILPYPRSGMLSSSADDRAIYLSPGVRPYAPWQVHFLVAHEIGHIVHHRYLPVSDPAGWEEWAELRGVDDPVVYHSRAPRADRPHEIFAEDFRVLFGGTLARRDGTVENQRITPPQQVPGLREYYLSLIGTVDVASLAWRVGPNPVRIGQRIVLRAPDAVSGDAVPVAASLYDVTGRVVAAFDLRDEGSGQWSFSLDSRDRGQMIPAGAYWLRVADAAGMAGETLPIRVLR